MQNRTSVIVGLTAASILCTSCGPEPGRPTTTTGNSTPDRQGTAIPAIGARDGQWPGEYPTSQSLVGLRLLAIRTFVDRGIPPMPLKPGLSLAAEVEDMARQELEPAGADIVDERLAEALLEVKMYMQCDANATSCGYYTALELKQWTNLRRDPTAKIAAITWRNSYSGGIGRANLPTLASQLRVDAGTLLKGFARDLRAANGR